MDATIGKIVSRNDGTYIVVKVFRSEHDARVYAIKNKLKFLQLGNWWCAVRPLPSKPVPDYFFL